jgi:hypothetical protein
MASDQNVCSIAVGIELSILLTLGRIIIALFLALADVPNPLEANFWVSDLHGRSILRIRLVQVSISHTNTLPIEVGCTNSIGQHLATVVADDFEQLLCALDEARVVDWPGQLDMTEMARALGHVLGAGLALELPVNRSKQRIVKTAIAKLCPGLVHSLGIENMGYAHSLDLLRR